MSRAVEYLQLMTGVEFPAPDTMLHAYLQFEALTDHEYKYSCPSCGDHPPVVILGVHKPSTSHLSGRKIIMFFISQFVSLILFWTCGFYHSEILLLCFQTVTLKNHQRILKGRSIWKSSGRHYPKR